MGILIDTNFFYAIKIEDDKNHKEAIHILKTIEWQKYGTVITNNLIVAETLSLVNARTRGNLNALNTVSNLFFGTECFFKIVEIPLENYKEIGNLMVKYSTQNQIFSFCDASLLFLAQRRRIKDIISFDQHFDGKLTRIFN